MYSNKHGDTFKSLRIIANSFLRYEIECYLPTIPKNFIDDNQSMAAQAKLTLLFFNFNIQLRYRVANEQDELFNCITSAAKKARFIDW